MDLDTGPTPVPTSGSLAFVCTLCYNRPMLKELLGKIVGDANEREIDRMAPLIKEINDLEAQYQPLTDEQLQALTAGFRAEVREATADLAADVADLQARLTAEPDADDRRALGLELETARKRLRDAEEEVLSEILPRAFAAVREAARRTLGERHFDEQLKGGIVLHRGKIAEMRTGEGKTLVATLPLYLNSLLGHGAHLVTPNDYLSKFGVQWMGPVYHLLGVSVGVIQSAAENPMLGSFVYDPAYPATDDRYQHLRPVQRREAYLADITYGTNNEFGFDSLRDNMVWDLNQCVQRELFYAIVDEVDNILIDEARTPLIISGPAEESGHEYSRLASIVQSLKQTHFSVEAPHAFEIAPGKSSEIRIEFAPKIPGKVSGTLVIHSNDRRLSHIEIPLRGGDARSKDRNTGHEAGLVATGACIRVDKSPIDWGVVRPGGSESVYLRIDNVSETEPLRITSLETGDYVVDEKARQVTLTEGGIEHVQRLLNVGDLYQDGQTHWLADLENALRANVLYQRDRDYVIKDGQVIIVDEFTGRLMYGRRYSEGLHEAIEAKERVDVKQASLTLATISFQNYFRMYSKLAGMTGTAATEAEEFQRIYSLDVTTIPTHRPMIRQDMPDQVYKTEKAKFRAVVQEIRELSDSGRPILVGTTSVETSEMLAGLLDREGIKRYQVLNAKQHEKEAIVVAQAGRSGAVTIATNMAGRGVDILLGGKPDGLARETLRKQGVDLTQVDPEVWQRELEKARVACAEDKERVVAAGGLHVIGTERHEARRIDNQLRGRAGRQGDPGSSRFFVSLEDDLMKRFGGATVAGLMDRLGVDESIPIEHSLISSSIANAQVKVEGYNFDLRKHLLDYDDVVNEQRRIIYEQRRLVLTSDRLKDTILEMVEGELRAVVAAHTAGDPSEWNLPGLLQAARTILPIAEKDRPQWQDLSSAEIEAQLLEAAASYYEQKEQQQGEATMRQLERLLMLNSIDRLWVRHLTALDELREGIGLRAIAQRNPLVEYKREAFDMFEELKAAISSEVAHRVYFASLVRQPVRREAAQPARRPGQNARSGAVPTRSPLAAAAAPARKPAAAATVGRNDPCPCGSGKKYKNCCMRH